MTDDRHHNEIKIRLAIATDCEQVARLVREGGFEVDGIDWRDLGGNWIVAESPQPSAVSDQQGRNGVVGCLQICPARPIGRLEFLCVDRALRKRERALVAGALVVQGLATLKIMGAQAASNVVGFDNKAFAKILRRRGAKVMTQGHMFIKMLSAVSPQPSAKEQDFKDETKVEHAESGNYDPRC